VILVGIDDTDIVDSPGTNQLARLIAKTLSPRYDCRQITRHQLLFDPRVPYTSHNSSASLALEPQAEFSLTDLIVEVRQIMLGWYIEGSDPGLCVTTEVPPEVSEFGRKCQREVVHQSEAREIALRTGLHLEGLGGTQDGVIGALAAVGLYVTCEDGRVIQQAEWPDDLSGLQPIALLRERGIEVLAVKNSLHADLPSARLIDVGKHLRPNRRDGRVVLFVEFDIDAQIWKAVKCS